MPFDGTDYQPMSIEERALRHALAFFTNESKWFKGGCQNDSGTAKCVGTVLGEYPNATSQELYNWRWISDVLGLKPYGGADWNDRECPSFAALQAHLRTRIKHYEAERLKVAA